MGKKLYHAQTQAVKNHQNFNKLNNRKRILPSQNSKFNHLETETEETSDPELDSIPQEDIPKMTRKVTHLSI